MFELSQAVAVLGASDIPQLRTAGLGPLGRQGLQGLRACWGCVGSETLRVSGPGRAVSISFHVGLQVRPGPAKAHLAFIATSEAREWMSTRGATGGEEPNPTVS